MSSPFSSKPPEHTPVRVAPHNTLKTKPLRTWPAILFILAALGIRLAPMGIPDPGDEINMAAGLGPVVAGLLLILWWLFASRARIWERLFGVIGMGLLGGLTYLASDPTMQGYATLIMLTVPMGIIGFSFATLFLRRSNSFRRVMIALLVSTLSFGFSILLRNEGMWGHAKIDLRWRWTPTAEQEMLTDRGAQPAPENVELPNDDFSSALESPDWPGFRGPDRNSRQAGTRLATDWLNSPPELLWRIAVGPGWSSFAVAGPALFTQEQRADQECVVCYEAETGKEVWVAQIQARFSDPLGGPGPRATPYLHGGRLYALGADGDLRCINPIDGSPIWHQNIQEIAQREPPEWGFSSSPLVRAGKVIVHAGGEGASGVLAFAAETGELAWTATSGDHAYSSPQPATINGEDLVIMQTNYGFRILDPNSGQIRLSYAWPQRGYRALQPQVVGDNALVLASEMNNGARRIELSANGETLIANDIWTSRFLKSDFNDFVYHQDHLYGFDGGIFASVDATTGKRNWKDGRYGKGQVLLIQDSGLLLIMSERGEGILLRATPEKHEELAKLELLEGKTWNHPVLVGDRLYVRNSQEAACYKLATEPAEESQTP